MKQQQQMVHGRGRQRESIEFDGLIEVQGEQNMGSSSTSGANNTAQGPQAPDL